MNIFLTSPDLKQCAKNLDDKRLNKMIIETAQILSSGIRLYSEANSITLPDTLEDRLYKLTHKNHPSVKWCSENFSNIMLITELFHKYAEEWIYRFNKQHTTLKRFTRIYTNVVLNHLNNSYIDSLSKARIVLDTLPPKVVLDQFKDLPIHEAYQQHLNYKWNHDKTPPKWTKRGLPTFYTNSISGAM